MLWFHGDDKLDAVITGLRWECAWLMGALDIFSTLAPSFAHVAVFLSDCLSSTCHSVHLLLFFNLLSMSLRPFDSSTRLHGDTWLTFIHINSIRSFHELDWDCDQVFWLTSPMHLHAASTDIYVLRFTIKAGNSLAWYIIHTVFVVMLHPWVGRGLVVCLPKRFRTTSTCNMSRTFGLA